jgi:hypothetical protein
VSAVFLVDDILLLPVRGVLWVSQKIQSAAREEIMNKEQMIRVELSDLYMMLESGRVTEQEFEAQEKSLLDELDALQAPARAAHRARTDG